MPYVLHSFSDNGVGSSHVAAWTTSVDGYIVNITTIQSVMSRSHEVVHHSVRPAAVLIRVCSLRALLELIPCV